MRFPRVSAWTNTPSSREDGTVTEPERLRTSLRTVSPLISRAITGPLEQIRARSSAEYTLPGLRLPLTEAHHHALLDDLAHEGGIGAVFRAGFRLTNLSEDPLIVELAHSHTPHEVLHRFRRLEPMLHLGHQTEADLAENSMSVTHTARHGAEPRAAASIFVCGAFVGMLARMAIPDLHAHLADGRARSIALWPITDEPKLAAAVAPFVWTLEWTPSATVDHSVTETTSDTLRTLVARQPALPWDLGSAAAALHLSERTLQRRHTEAGLTVSQVIRAGRLDAAEPLLRRTNLSAAIIAGLCGFSDLSHLTRALHHRHGLPPGRFRRMADTILRGR